MSTSNEVFVIQLPAAASEPVTSALPPGFVKAPPAKSGRDFRFGISDLHEYIGAAKDLADFALALLGLLAAARAAGITAIWVRRPSETEPTKIDADDNAATIQEKLMPKHEH